MCHRFLVYLLLAMPISALPQAFSQKPVTVYCLPGQGADQRQFDSLLLDSPFVKKVINYGTPASGTTMAVFARQLIPLIDTSTPFVLLGVSLGGMLCAELAELIPAQRTILISSCKNSQELPARYRFQRHIPLYKMVPGCVLLAGAKLLQPLVEPDRNKNKPVFKSMLGSKTPEYMKRSIALIIGWQLRQNRKPLYHIHGTNDHTLPFRKIKPPVCRVVGGSHMMTLTRGREITRLVNKVLKE